MTHSSGQLSFQLLNSRGMQFCVCVLKRLGDLSVKNVEEHWGKGIKFR